MKHERPKKSRRPQSFELVAFIDVIINRVTYLKGYVAAARVTGVTIYDLCLNRESLLGWSDCRLVRTGDMQHQEAEWIDHLPAKSETSRIVNNSEWATVIVLEWYWNTNFKARWRQHLRSVNGATSTWVKHLHHAASLVSVSEAQSTIRVSSNHDGFLRKQTPVTVSHIFVAFDADLQGSP